METTEAERHILPSSIRFVVGVDEAGRGCMAGPVGVAATLYRISNVHVEYTVMDSKSMREGVRGATLDAMCQALAGTGADRFLAQVLQDGMCCIARRQRHQPLQAIAVKLVDVAVINERNILNATLEGMSAVCDAAVRAYNDLRGPDTLTPQNCAILIDGNRVPWALLSDDERRQTRALAQKKMELLKRIGAEYPSVAGFPCTTVVKGDATLLSVAAASVVAKVSRDAFAVGVMHLTYPQYGFLRHKGYCTAEHQEALQRLGPCSFHRLHYAPVKAVMEEKGPRLKHN